MKTAFKIFSAGLLFVLCFLSFGCTDVNLNIQPEKVNISVIVTKQGPGFWTVVEMGAKAAGKEFNANIIFEAPVNEQDIDMQIGLVEEAIESADALVLAACDYYALIPVAEKAKGKGMPVIIMNSDLNSDKMDSFVGTDNVDAGHKLGESLIDKVGDKCKIAIMSFVKGAATANQREAGFRNEINVYPYIEVLDTLYCNSEESIAEMLAKQTVQMYPDINAFVCLNAAGTVGTARAIEEIGQAGNIKIIGFDSTSAEVSYVEKDVVQSLVVQYSFNMGYLGVKYALDALNNEQVPKRVNTGSIVIDKNNMYIPENQKLVFPFNE